VLILTVGLLYGAAQAIFASAAALDNQTITFPAIRNKTAAPNTNQSSTAKQATLGMPTSADFLLKAYDPRKHDYAYATFKRLPDGRGIVFGGFGAVTTGNNAVTAYNPVTNTWETLFATQTFTIGSQLSDGTYDVRGKSFLGNRDTQFGLVVPSRNEYWVGPGQRSQPLTGNFMGAFNYITKVWTVIQDDQNTFAPVTGWSYYSGPADGCSVRIPETDTLVTMWSYSSGSLATSTLTIMRPNGTSPQTYTAEVHHDLNNFSWAGQRLLRNTQSQCFARNGEVYVYGGYDELGGFSSADISRVNVTVPGKPVQTTVTTNTVPQSVRVYGQSVLADWDPARDRMVVTNGINVNIYDFGTHAWANVPVNTPPDDARNSPTTSAAGGASHGCFWAPGAYVSPGVFADQLILNGQGNGTTYGLRLNY
jgi:hypothetical protein